MLHREVEEHDRERELDRTPHNEKTDSMTQYKIKLTQLNIKLNKSVKKRQGKKRM